MRMREKTGPVGSTSHHLLLTGGGLVRALLPEHEPGAPHASIGLGVLGPVLGGKGLGRVSTGQNPRAPSGNPLNAFLISSFSFFFIIHPPSHPLPPLIHLCFQKGLLSVDCTQACMFLLILFCREK